MISAGEHRVRDLRLDRRVLRAEHARVTWWRRLVRARLDLAVAQAARPQSLGEDVAFQLPPEIGVEVPRPAALAAVLGAHPRVRTASGSTSSGRWTRSSRATATASRRPSDRRRSG